MKKIYLFLLVTVFSMAGMQKNAFAGNNPCTLAGQLTEINNPTDPLYPYGFVFGNYSPVISVFAELYLDGQLMDPATYFAIIDAGDIQIYDLPAGNFSLVLYDFEGSTCSTSIDFSITGLACDLSLVNASTMDLTGSGCTPNGSMDLQFTSTSPQTYYYSISELFSQMEYTGQDDGSGIIQLANLPAGIYSVMVSIDPDIANATCLYSSLLEINEPACDMEITASGSSDVTTQGGMDGSINVSVIGSSCFLTPPGGVAFYNVSAQLNGNTVGTLTYNPNTLKYELTGLAAGSYTVIASNGGTTCSASTIIVVGENSGCNLTAPVISGVNTTICNGAPAIISASQNYNSYQWFYEGSVLIPIAGVQWNYWAYLEGNYSVVVTDGNGCSATSNSVYVSAPLSPEINFPDTFYTCNSSLTITAPSAFDTYIWSTYDTTASITVTTSGWYGLGAGVATLTCGVVDSFYVSLDNVAPTVSITIVGGNTEFCAGNEVTLESSNATGNTWNTGSNDQSITVNASGTYSVVVENAIGCTASDEVTLTEINCVPPTQLTSSYCGKLNFVKTSAIICADVTGATQYEWQFSDGNGVYATKITPVNYVALHGVSPVIDWGNQYTVKVRAYFGTIAGVYGVGCTIGLIADPSQSGVPLTKLRSVDCGKLNYRINANNRIVSTPVTGATQFEFEFSDVITNAVVVTKLEQYNVLFFNTLSPALAFPAQYNVRVRARVGAAWGSYGDACLIGIIGLNRDAGDNVYEQLVYNQEGAVIDVKELRFDITAVPNPYTNNSSITINATNNENVYVQFFDMTGRMVQDMNVTTNQRFVAGAEFSQGIYMLKAISESGKEITTRLVKTN